MRTNIEIDDTLMREAMAELGAKTKREAVESALRRSIKAARQLRAWDDLRGTDWEGDLDAMRTDKPLPSFE